MIENHHVTIQKQLLDNVSFWLLTHYDIVDKEINNVGKILAEGQADESKLSRLRGLSLQDFMKDNDKIIKDK